jgi:hypothetical protein
MAEFIDEYIVAILVVGILLPSFAVILLSFLEFGNDKE